MGGGARSRNRCGDAAQSVEGAPRDFLSSQSDQSQALRHEIHQEDDGMGADVGQRSARSQKSWLSRLPDPFDILNKSRDSASSNEHHSRREGVSTECDVSIHQRVSHQGIAPDCGYVGRDEKMQNIHLDHANY